MCEIHDCVVGSRGFQHIESRVQDVIVAVGITGSSEWSAHGVSHDDCAWDLHLGRPVSEGPHEDRHGRGARFFDCSRNVPDRHMAHRSDRHEEHDVDVLLLDAVDPSGNLVAKPSL